MTDTGPTTGQGTVQPKPSPTLADIARLPLWVIWKAVPKPKQADGKAKFDKPPMDPRTGRKGSKNDPAIRMTRADAEACARRWGFTGDKGGIGILTLPFEHNGQRWQLACLDTDHCYSDDDDRAASWADENFAVLDGHLSELSPSRTGRHHWFILRVDDIPDKVGEHVAYKQGEKPNQYGFDLFMREGFYATFTELDAQGELQILSPGDLIRLFNALETFSPHTKPKPKPTFNGSAAHRASEHDMAIDILDHLPNGTDYDDRLAWFAIVGAVFNATNGSAQGRAAITRWTRDGDSRTAEEGIDELYKYFARVAPRADIGHLVNEAKAHDYDPFKRNPPPPPPGDPLDDLPLDVVYRDFVAYMPQAGFIFMPTGQLWPASSVNRRLPWIDNGPDLEPTSPSSWLAKHQPVEQMTWLPGAPSIIRDRLIVEAGWIERHRASIYNQYRPPTLELGDPTQATRWCDLVRKLWPDDADHIFNCLAHRRQKPRVKINHALVLGGLQGIGKDTVLEAAVQAVGPQNVHSISPAAFAGRFNGFVKSVILRVSEARDADYNPFQFYEHEKVYAAAPPDALRVDEKNKGEYYVPNLCLLIITTNHLTGGLYLPSDDRRHYVAWSDLSKDDFTADFWSSLWRWYNDGGFGHVAAWLDERDLSAFNPKAPPPKTDAFWTIVNASRASEDAELADTLDKLDNPVVTTLDTVLSLATGDFNDWLADRRNRRLIPHRFEACGYFPVRNPDANDGLWKIDGARQVVYGHRDHDRRAHIARIRLMGQRKKT